MAQANNIVGDDEKDVIGCTDSTAINYNVFATKTCEGYTGTYLKSNCNSGAPPNAICSGCCYKIISTNEESGDPIKGDGGTESNDGIPDLGSGVSIIDFGDIFNCPRTEQLTWSNTDPIVITFEGQNLSDECCTESVVGAPVTYTQISSRKYACTLNKQSNPCPPIEAIQISAEDQTTILGIKTKECCEFYNSENFLTVWDGRFCLYQKETNDCPFDDFIVEQSASNPDTPLNTLQVFGSGTSSKELIPLSHYPNCCTTENVGVEVIYDTELKLCLYQVVTPPPAPQPIIVINEEPIINDDCDDLLISAKIYFARPPKECFSDIVASLLPDNPSFTVEQLGIFNSQDDEFNTWVDLGLRVVTTTSDSFNVNLVFNGLLICCDYDIRIDNVRVDCFKEEDRAFYQKNDCPGFDLKRVIDNKKSWVYNPGTDEIGLSTEDIIDRNQGDVGLLEKFGFVNRTFAPSSDADLPWRYTDYYEQSNIKEPHSKAVINSKEMELTFNMCSECCIEDSPCPAGYTLSANTKSCYKTTCPDGYKLSGTSMCYSASTEVPVFITSGFTSQGAVPPQDLINTNIISNPVPFNSFLTAGISTGDTVNIPLSGISYTISSIIDYRSLDLNSPPLISPTFDFSGVYYEIYTTPPETLYTNPTILTEEYGSYCLKKVSLLQLEDYKKTFQSFWVRMIEQFVPATTIFVSGEKWCNNNDLICTEFGECDYDYEYVDSEITVIEYGTDFAPVATGTTNTNNGGDVPDENSSDTTINNESGGEPNNSDDGPIMEDGTTVITTPSEPTGLTETNEKDFTGPTDTQKKGLNNYMSITTKAKSETIFK